ncbi:GIY-YIG nuclease family protein [Sulfitobacter sp. 20_GPM-1509m]|uniref:GIY-YIG nuclease family protein n=1 Tax=Sulfitobacter sp. 20_GPM-1509m TaxID=1380367 RepID=UPI0004914931|nr:GIY-YIG nuclease family protein [Sulfitobacter sp. 20_GPM-1509m]
MKTALYRHFDADGVLLYVGISNTVFSRLNSHMNQASWAEYISRIELQWFDDRDAALRAEADAITSERPVHNKMMASTDSGAAITDLINLWPTRLDLARDVGASNVAVHRWAERNRIPAEWLQSVLDAAHKRGFSHITAAWIVSALAKEPAQ